MSVKFAGELREQAERAFGIEGEVWDAEREERFAVGLERWINQRRVADREEVYDRGKTFVGTVYRGIGKITDTSRMDEIFERMFAGGNVFNT